MITQSGMTTSDDVAFLSALHLADSALPTGRGVHSNGFESWLNANPEVDPAAISELVETVILEAVAPLDGVFIAHAHGALSASALVELDCRVTAFKLSASAREASESMGRRLVRVAPHLGATSPMLDCYFESISSGSAPGNFAVVEGAVAAMLGVGRREAVVVAIRSAAVDLISAAVRLGRLPALGSQRMIADLAPAIARGATVAVDAPLEQVRSHSGELELAALVHARSDSRHFAT